MKRYFAFLFALVVLAAVIPAVSALYTCNYTPELPTFTGNAPWTFESGIDTYAQTGPMCSACGFSNSTPSVVFNLYDVNQNMFDYRHTAWEIGDYTVSSNSTMFYQRGLDCGSNHYVRISDGACSVFDYAYREPRNPACCTVGSYSLPLVNFTGTPNSGSIPLSVVFTVQNLTNTTGVTWAFGDGNVTTASGGTISHVYQYPGIYSQTMTYSNISNVRETATKLNYISATEGEKLVYLIVQDGKSGLYINGYTANVYDTSRALWTNGTPADGVLTITTNTSAFLTANVSATGYVSTVKSMTARADDWPEDWTVTIFKTGDMPNSTNLANTSLRIWVTGSAPEGSVGSDLSLPGVSVLLSDGQAMFTPDSGIAEFTVLNGSSYNWEANKYPDYYGATGVITASGAVTNINVLLRRAEGELPTPTPSVTSTRVTPTLTGSALAQHNAEQDQSMLNQLRDAGPGIIGLCILVIILSLMRMLGGK